MGLRFKQRDRIAIQIGRLLEPPLRNIDHGAHHLAACRDAPLGSVFDSFGNRGVDGRSRSRRWRAGTKVPRDRIGISVRQRIECGHFVGAHVGDLHVPAKDFAIKIGRLLQVGYGNFCPNDDRLHEVSPC